MRFSQIAALIGLLLACLAGPVVAAPNGTPIDSGWQLQDAAKVTVDGAAISQVGYRSSHWLGAVVPGTVLTSLVHDGIYPEPLYGENNRPNKIPESLCRTSYWYRTEFTVPKSDAHRQVWLHFDGINFTANVWVNGHSLGAIQGAFARGIFNVTDVVTPGRANALAVHVFPQPHPGETHEKTQATGTGHNGGESAIDGPTFLCAIGWDWIPGIRDRDAGIWQDVRLSSTGPVTIENPDVTSDLPLPRTDSADLTVQATLANVTTQPETGTLVGTFGTTTFRQPITLAASETRTVTLTPATTPALHVLHPRLWWPNGYGPQNLYQLHLKFVTATDAISDTHDTQFGIRKITYFVQGSDNLTLSVNSVPILAKGGDWGMDEAMKRIPPARLDAMVHYHQLANYTIIRNWVGQSTSEAFYDACDKYGILVWDEFFQPNPGDGPNPDDPDIYLANVREKLLRFRSHPCIALWCARNEGNPPPSIGDGIQAMITQLDPGRLYQPSSTSGHGVQSGGPYFWRVPRDFYNVDAPFKTEIGSVSVPTLEAVEGMMPQKDWNVIDDYWAEHDFCAGAQQGDQYPHILASRYGYPSSLADFVRKAQMMNYEAFRAMYEGREVQLFHPVTGVITWMSNPAQPSFVWQLYSHDLEPNASLFAVRKACEPIHVMMNQVNGDLEMINNTPRALNGLSATVGIYNLDGSRQYAHTSAAVSAAPSAATDLGPIAFPTTSLSPVYFVKLELRDSAHHLLSDNFYWRATTQDDLQALDTMPRVALAAHVMHQDVGRNLLLTVTLRNLSHTPALMAHLQLRRAHSGKRVLPVFYSDNYISLLPGETKTLTVEAARADLAGEQPLLVVDGWNVSVSPSAGITPNTAALIAPGPATVAAALSTLPLRINCGGSQTGFFTFGSPTTTTGGFSSDTDFVGGSTKTVGDPITMSVTHAAPQAIYQSERWGACTYTLPVPKRDAPYTVRLHFAETTFKAAGARQFNVAINGVPVLTNFDVFAEAGGADKAVVRDFAGIHPNAQGNIVIAFTNGAADQPKISGIEVF